MSEITSDLCRLCLKESFTLHNIYSSHTTSGDLVYRVLNFVYDLEITPDDGLLTQICAPCMWKMLEFEGYKRNVHYARVEIVKLLSKLREASTEGCDSDERPTESDSAQEILPGEEPKQEESDLIVENENQFHNYEDMEIVEWQMPEELKREEMDFGGSCIESVLHTDPNLITIDRASTSSTVILQGMDLQLKQEESELYLDQVAAVQSAGSSDLMNCLRLEASEETVVTSFEGESSSICTSQDICGKNRVTNKVIPENDLRGDVVAVEESLSDQISKSILNVAKSGRFNLKTSLSKRKSEFICDICKMSFKQKVHLGRHVRVHYDDRPFCCNICDKTFKQASVRYYHELRHLRPKMSVGESEKETNKILYSCDLCAKNFCSKSGLWRHSNLHNNKYKCNSCGKYFGRNFELGNHLRTHTKEKPFKCEVCLKCFPQKGNLNAHLLIHSSERPYICEICDKRFRSKGEKTQHALYHLRKE